MADGVTIKLEGTTYRLDDFELGDLEWLEDYIGKPLSDGEAALGTMKAAVAFVYLIKRRDNPAFTLDEARKVKMTAFEDVDADEAAKPKRPTRPAKG
jgi:hypothetical protein